MTKIIKFNPTGIIDTTNSQNFRNELMRAVNSLDNSTILIDMKEIDFLDSAGLMILINAYKSAQNRGKKLSLCSISPSVRIIFELSQLDKVFDIFESSKHFQQSFAEAVAA